MMKSTAFGLGCAFLAGAALAFPAGLIFAGRMQPRSPPEVRADPRSGELLDPFSPNITQDPYFIEQEQRNLAALERACRTSGKFCDEAALFRRSLAERGAH